MGGAEVKVQPCCVQSNHWQAGHHSTGSAPGVGGNGVKERSKKGKKECGGGAKGVRRECVTLKL